jgi:hypothetical protein
MTKHISKAFTPALFAIDYLCLDPACGLDPQSDTFALAAVRNDNIIAVVMLDIFWQESVVRHNRQNPLLQTDRQLFKLKMLLPPWMQASQLISKVAKISVF